MGGCNVANVNVPYAFLKLIHEYRGERMLLFVELLGIFIARDELKIAVCIDVVNFWTASSI